MSSLARLIPLFYSQGQPSFKTLLSIPSMLDPTEARTHMAVISAPKCTQCWFPNCTLGMETQTWFSLAREMKLGDNQKDLVF